MTIHRRTTALAALAAILTSGSLLAQDRVLRLASWPAAAGALLRPAAHHGLGARLLGQGLTMLFDPVMVPFSRHGRFLTLSVMDGALMLRSVRGGDLRSPIRRSWSRGGRPPASAPSRSKT